MSTNPEYAAFKKHASIYYLYHLSCMSIGLFLLSPLGNIGGPMMIVLLLVSISLTLISTFDDLPDNVLFISDFLNKHGWPIVLGIVFAGIYARLSSEPQYFVILFLCTLGYQFCYREWYDSCAKKLQKTID